jgi:hypothetical protein
LDTDMTLDIAAEGQIAFSRNHQLVGPDGDRSANASDVKYPIASAGFGALIARIQYDNGNYSAPRFVGPRGIMRIGSSDYGRLFIGINDNDVSDNTGSYRVTIRW